MVDEVRISQLDPTNSELGTIETIVIQESDDGLGLDNFRAEIYSVETIDRLEQESIDRDSSLGLLIDNEVQARIDGDTALDDRIDYMYSYDMVNTFANQSINGTKSFEKIQSQTDEVISDKQGNSVLLSTDEHNTFGQNDKHVRLRGVSVPKWVHANGSVDNLATEQQVIDETQARIDADNGLASDISDNADEIETHATELLRLETDKEDSVSYGDAGYMAVVNNTGNGFEFVPQPSYDFIQMRGTLSEYTDGIDPSIIAIVTADPLNSFLYKDVPPNIPATSNEDVRLSPNGYTYIAQENFEAEISDGDGEIPITSGDFLLWSGVRWNHIPVEVGVGVDGLNNLTGMITLAGTDGITVTTNVSARTITVTVDASVARTSELNALIARVTQNEASIDDLVTEVERVETESTQRDTALGSRIDSNKNDITKLNAVRPTRNLATMEAERQANKNLFAASSFVHYGYHDSYAPTFAAINEGLFARHDGTNTGWANALGMGRGNGATTTAGASLTEFPITHIAGFVSEIFGLHDGLQTNFIKFPEAPDGTIIYDSTGDARGTGQANLNLLTEIDPKYGNTAQDAGDSAPARAFEGEIWNGDFRTDSLDNWTASGNLTSISNGVLTVGSDTAANSSAIPDVVWEDGFTYKIEVSMASVTGDLVRCVLPDADDTWLTGDGIHTATFVADASKQLTLDFQGGVVAGEVEFYRLSVRKVTEEVVTEPVDMFGGEFFLESVTPETPYGYLNGMIQTQVTDMNGVPTERSNRPDTYYAVFDGDTGSSGLGVNLLDLGFADFWRIASHAPNNLYNIADGVTSDWQLVQWRMRQRTIRGAGNGDFAMINPVGNDNGTSLKFNVSGQLSVAAQGALNSQEPYSSSGEYIAHLPTSRYYNQNIGVFKAHETNTIGVAVNGECYFHVWGSCPRLNSGVHHPSNDMGAAQATDGYWWESSLINSLADCFIHNVGGDIASGISGRTEGNLYHDGIGASGQGGVIDDRLSAYEVTLEDVSKAKAKLKNGVLRGVQKLPWTKVFETTVQTGGTSFGRIWIPEDFKQELDAYTGRSGGSDIYRGYFGILGYNTTTDMFAYISGDSSSGTSNLSTALHPDTNLAYVDEDGKSMVAHMLNLGEALTGAGNSGNADAAPFASAGDVIQLVVFNYLETSVEGNADNGFTVNDVIGDPANILQTQVLANGWLGHWVTAIPNGANKTFSFSRKSLISQVSRTSTDNNGTSWTNQNVTLDTVTNGITTTKNSTRIEVNSYQAAPHQTEQDENSPVLFGEKGLGKVWATARGDNLSDGVLFTESLIGKVCTSNLGTSTAITHELSDYRLSSSAVTITNGYCKHNPIAMAQPANDSPAVKALIYPTSENQQVRLNVAYNELVYSSVAPIELSIEEASGSYSYTAGVTYKVPYVTGFIFWTCVATWTGTISILRNRNGDSLYSNSGTSQAYFVYAGDEAYNNASGWGDDSTVRITDGQGTYENLNGDTCLYGTNRTTKPIGYTKNRARIGGQDAGVDFKQTR